MTAYFVRHLGPAHVDQAEDIVQEALFRALKTWPFKGVPDHARAWLWRVARNVATDRFRQYRPTDPLEDVDAATEPLPPSRLHDAELDLLFLCADPDLRRDAAIPLTLKLACGFGTAEIAGALSVPEATIRQRIVRAKKRWRTDQPSLDLDAAQIGTRIDGVMNVIYLMLNEGYGGHHPDHWQRAELCREAARLAELLAMHERTERRDAAALAALCLFQLARLPARLDGEGDIILMEDQDRTLWDGALTARAFRWLRVAGKGNDLSTYHLLAGIAAAHAAAPDYAGTDWPQVRRYYDLLLERDPSSPFHVLNRAVAVAETDGSASALETIEGLSRNPLLGRSYLLPATRAWLLARAGQRAEAKRDLIRAVDLAPSPQLRRQLQRRLETM